ncbi:MAG: TolC family protein [Mariprofundales bacterium]|nr:TolC family protein [Mariprofundales bacterium]
MRILSILSGVLLCSSALYANEVTLTEAMDAAVAQHPALTIATQTVDGARGDLQEQGAYAYNPELSIEPQRRALQGGGSTNDYYLTISQGVELGGKQRYRQNFAQAELEAVQLESGALRQQIAINAARAFVELYFSKRELVWRNQQSATLSKLYRALSRQMEVGATDQLSLNLAKASLTQAINAESRAKQQYATNLSAYLLAIGGDGVVQGVQPVMPALRTEWRPPSTPVEVALHSRPDLAAKRQRLRSSTAQADLARAQQTPDITVALMAAREAGDRLISLALTLPIQVLNSHRGAYIKAESQRAVSEVDLQLFEQRVRLEVEEALVNHATAMQALESMRTIRGESAAVEGALTLARRAFDAGELEIAELVIHINQILESRINSAAMLKSGWLARIRLAAVLGHPEYIIQGEGE